MRRREFIRIPAQALGGVLLYTLAGEPVLLQAQKQPGDSIRVDLVRKRWFGGKKKLNYEITLQ